MLNIEDESHSTRRLKGRHQEREWMHESKRLEQVRLWKNCVEQSRNDLSYVESLTARFLSTRQIDL